MTVKFGTPPPARKRPARYQDEADTLRAHPGEWALFDGLKPTMASSLRTQINSGKREEFPRGQFEAIVRRGQLWARYTGGAVLRSIDAA